MPRHVNIPIFVVHMGCPNQCVFCDQRLISGSSCFSETAVRAQINPVAARPRREGERREIAFFGGSFTGIERVQMIALLDIAESYVRDGAVDGIRFSTRPDYISEEILAVLSRYTVAAVELGVQSMDDAVLRRTRRGHTAEDTRAAFRAICAQGIPTVGQMMLGLPGATPESELACAREIITLGAAGCRVYPTLVFRGSELADMTARGEYQPLSIPDAVSRMASVLTLFADAGVPCLRAGLCETDGLREDGAAIAGPYHPAIGELARSEMLYRRVRNALAAMEPFPRALRISVPCGMASVAAGHRRENIRRLGEEYGIKYVKIIENPSLIGYNITLDDCTSDSRERTRRKPFCD